jgi:C4-dicarboxylate transporter DctM subunit
MSHEISPAQPELTGWRRFLRDGENLGVTLALFAMMLLPLAAMIVRRQFSGAAPLVQHLTLLVGVLGGAIAARDNRLLALSTLTTFLKGRWKTAVAVFSGAFGAAVSIFLCVAGVKFVREAGADVDEMLAFGIRVRWVQWLLPACFGVVGIRLLWHSAKHWRGRVVALIVFAILVGVPRFIPVSPEQLKWPALGMLFVATVLGAPVFTTLGGAALILFWASDTPIAAISITHYSLVVNPSLPTIPLFTLAGYFLAEGGASARLVRVFNALVGRIRGGPAIVTALVCAFFTSFTGASGVTILALGGLLMPVLIGAKYSERNALGLLTGAGSLGLLFPPCLPLILYAIISTQARAPVTIEQMFLAGIVPGFLLVGLTAWWGIAVGPKSQDTGNRFDVAEARRAIWEAKWELLLPVVALVALFGGFATPVEAAAVTAFYAFIIETFVYRDLRILVKTVSPHPDPLPASGARGVSSPPSVGGEDQGEGPRRSILNVATECGLLVGGVLLILGVANGFTNYLVDARIPAKLVEWTTASISSPWKFLLLLNVFLLVVGCLMDIYSAIVVVVPLLVPIGRQFGINPIHLGIIFLANLELGYLTPPVGMNLFLSSYRFKKPMAEVTRAVIPMLLVLLAGVLLITYIPPLTTTLPRWFGK